MSHSRSRVLVAALACALLVACGRAGEPAAPTPSEPGSGGQSGTGGRRAGGTGGREAAGGTGGSGLAGTGGAQGQPGSGGATGKGEGGSAGTVVADAAAADGADAVGPANPSSEPNPELDRACTPGVELKLMDKGPGGKLFTDAVGADVEGFLQQIGRAVCRVLYRKASEVRNATHLELLIEDDPGVAWKAGDGANITVMISTRHLGNINNMGGDVRFEISGILYHEMTHMYQHDDSDGKGVDLGVIEGIADFVRLQAGYAAKHWGKASPGGKWNDGYTRTAFFLDWANKKYPDFVYKLNLTMDSKDGKKWSPAAFQQVSGKTVDELWAEYQASF